MHRFKSANVAKSVRQKVPRLLNGDHLTLPEFERRYELMPGNQKAELIEGIVYLMTSPVRYTCHSKPDATLTWLLGMYRCMTPGVGPGGPIYVLPLGLPFSHNSCGVV